MSRERYKFRAEKWGGLALDWERDRLWAFDNSAFQRFERNPELIQEKTGFQDPFCYTGASWFGSLPSRSDFSLSAPISVSWTVTRRCQSACIFCCTNSHSRAAWGADLETIKRALSTLSRWGALRLIVGGGEPLIRTDIEAILAQAAEAGLPPAVATNGFLLTDRMAKQLASYVMQFQISLDSVRPDEYAALRGAAGGPHLALRAIENGADAGRSVRVVTVLNSRNIGHLDEIAEAVDRSSATQWFIFLMQPSGRGARIFQKIGIRDSDYARGCVARAKAGMREDIGVCFWGDTEEDGIAVYLNEDCRVVLTDYSKDTHSDLQIDLSACDSERYLEIWDQLDVGAKYATLRNFTSPRRVL